MSDFALPVTCPHCGAEVEYVNATASGWLAVTIVACGPCRRQWEVTVRIVQHAKVPA